MTIIRGNNFSRQSVSYDNTHFIECNFSQETQGTALDLHNCKFESCNLTNCSLDSTNEIIDCNTTQVVLDG